MVVGAILNFGRNNPQVILGIVGKVIIAATPLRHIAMVRGTHNRSPARFAGTVSLIVRLFHTPIVGAIVAEANGMPKFMCRSFGHRLPCVRQQVIENPYWNIAGPSPR